MRGLQNHTTRPSSLISLCFTTPVSMCFSPSLRGPQPYVCMQTQLDENISLKSIWQLPQVPVLSLSVHHRPLRKRKDIGMGRLLQGLLLALPAPPEGVGARQRKHNKYTLVSFMTKSKIPINNTLGQVYNTLVSFPPENA